MRVKDRVHRKCWTRLYIHYKTDTMMDQDGEPVDPAVYVGGLSGCYYAC